MKYRWQHRSIFLRSFVMLMVLSLIIITIFALLMIPRGKMSILNGLESQAGSLSASIASVSGNAFVTGDYSFIVDHNMQVMKGGTGIRYIIIVKQDGPSLIHTGQTWEQRDKPDPAWNPAGRLIQQGRIIYSDIAKDTVYHYVYPLRFSGIDWGALYIGLSLERYNKDVWVMYLTIFLLGSLCFAVAIFVSFLSARQLTAPILLLRETADSVVRGDLEARARITSGDEVEDLARSFNRMTDTLVKAQSDISAAHDYMQKILRSITESLLVVDREGRITMVNRATLDWLGYSEQELIGQPISMVLGPEERLFDLESLRDLQRPGVLSNVEKTLYTKTGGEIPVLFSWSIIKQADVSAAGFVCVALDITERKQTELMLERSKETAEAANRAKSEFLANMSHEIRTPMNGILGTVELLLQTGLDAKQRNFAETAYRSANNLLNLLNDILDLSKIETGKLSLETIDFHVPELIQEVIGIFTLDGQAKGITFGASLDNNAITIVRGDPIRLRQVLVNLVGNAVKFTEKGRILIRLEQVEEKGERVRLRFSVSDTGIGIPIDKQRQIFDAFTQADPSTTRKHGGTGLGLTISRQLVSLMGGEIGVESREGEGSTFHFTANFCKGSPEKVIPQEKWALPFAGINKLPQPLHPLLGDGGEEAAHGNDWTGCRILVAEDNPVNKLVAMATISQLGCHADAVGTGKEALAALSEMSYDLVLMDCQMPEMDGYEATKIIREREQGAKHPRVPIIALTAHAMQGDRDACLAAGMDDYLAKPFHRDQLLAIFKRWII